MSDTIIEQISEKKSKQRLFAYEWGSIRADFYYLEKPMVSSLYRIGYVISGKGFMTLNGYEYNPEEGDTYLVKKGDVYYYSCDKDSPLNKFWVHFSGEAGIEILRFFHLEKANHFKGFDSFDLISRIHSMCSKSRDVANNARVNALFIQTIEALAARYHKIGQIKDPTEKIKMYIDINSSKDISSEELSNLIGVSVDHTIRLFKKKYGTTPYQYLLERKIELSKIYLALTDCSIDEITLILGFNDSSHFSRTFYKKVGERPLKYKNAMI